MHSSQYKVSFVWGGCDFFYYYFSPKMNQLVLTALPLKAWCVGVCVHLFNI